MPSFLHHLLLSLLLLASSPILGIATPLLPTTPVKLPTTTLKLPTSKFPTSIPISTKHTTSTSTKHTSTTLPIPKPSIVFVNGIPIGLNPSGKPIIFSEPESGRGKRSLITSDSSAAPAPAPALTKRISAIVADAMSIVQNMIPKLKIPIADDPNAPCYQQRGGQCFHLGGRGESEAPPLVIHTTDEDGEDAHTLPNVSGVKERGAVEALPLPPVVVITFEDEGDGDCNDQRGGCDIYGK